MSERPERFRSTGSLVTGWLGLLLVAVVVALGLLDRTGGLPLWSVFAALVVGAVLVVQIAAAIPRAAKP